MKKIDDNSTEKLKLIENNNIILESIDDMLNSMAININILNNLSSLLNSKTFRKKLLSRFKKIYNILDETLHKVIIEGFE